MANLYITDAVKKQMVDSIEFAKDVAECLVRFGNKDWGECCEEDIKANNEALKLKERIVATYKTTNGKIHIIYDNNHTTITVMFTHEY